MERGQFAQDEWYHCYSRGVEKRRTFETAGDYMRFLECLYVSNTQTPIHRSNYNGASHDHIIKLERGEPLVAIGAYCLMPNHYHIVIK